MAILSNPAFGPRTALAYITGGVLLVVWTAVYYFSFMRGSPEPISPTAWFWVYGLVLTGLVLIGIGALLGPIGRMAREAELPPEEALRAEAAIQQTAAAHPQPVVAGMGAAATGAPAGTVPAQAGAVPGAAVVQQTGAPVQPGTPAYSMPAGGR